MVSSTNKLLRYVSTVKKQNKKPTKAKTSHLKVFENVLNYTCVFKVMRQIMWRLGSLLRIWEWSLKISLFICLCISGWKAIGLAMLSLLSLPFFYPKGLIIILFILLVPLYSSYPLLSWNLAPKIWSQLLIHLNVDANLDIHTSRRTWMISVIVN